MLDPGALEAKSIRNELGIPDVLSAKTMIIGGASFSKAWCCLVDPGPTPEQ
jgi:hypothetical protein